MTCAPPGVTQHGECRSEEGRLSEQREIDHRPLLDQLDDEERDEKHRRTDEALDDRPRCPAERIAVDQRPDQQEEPDAERQDSGIVQTLGFVIARFIHEGRDRDEQSDADRQVDEEGPTPTKETRNDAADNRATGDRNADVDAPDRIGFCPLLLGERMIDDRERRGQHHAPTNAL
jgi:hypothetical protein